MLTNIIIIAVIAIILGLALFKVLRDKKKHKGKPGCAGCPYYSANNGCSKQY